MALPKILALLDSTNVLQEELFKLNGIDTYYVYLKVTELHAKLFRRICLEIQNGEFYYKKRFSRIDLNAYDLIILNETIFPENIIRFLRERYNGKIIYLLWNTLKYSGGPVGYEMSAHFDALMKMKEIFDFEIISFDRDDCQKYGLRFQNQFAYKFDMPPTDEQYDLIFIGRDKGRLEELEKILTSNRNLKAFIRIFPDKGKQYTSSIRPYLLQHFLPYKEVVSLLCSSRCIVDLVQEGQNGLTWRPLEAMFYGKKLITNYKNIKRYDFYHPDNVFILGKNDLDTLEDFVKGAVRPTSHEISERYQFKGWIKSVLEN